MENKETLEEAAEIFVNNRFAKQISGDKTYSDIHASKEAIIESHILFAKWQQEQDNKEAKILENILDDNYDLNVQFHKIKRECIYSFATAIYNEKLTFEEWEKKHYGNYVEQPKWQAERMYSEEDMKQFAWQCVANFLSNRDNKVERKLVDVIIDRNNLEFEQFKKK